MLLSGFTFKDPKCCKVCRIFHPIGILLLYNLFHRFHIEQNSSQFYLWFSLFFVLFIFIGFFFFFTFLTSRWVNFSVLNWFHPKSLKGHQGLIENYLFFYLSISTLFRCQKIDKFSRMLVLIHLVITLKVIQWMIDFSLNSLCFVLWFVVYVVFLVLIIIVLVGNILFSLMMTMTMTMCFYFW